MRNSKVLISILVVSLIGVVAFAGVVEAKSDKDIAYDMIDLFEDIEGTMSSFSSEEISYNTVISDFEDYAGTARFIYQDAIKYSENRELIKLTAGVSLTIDLYSEGFREQDVNKVKIANSILEKVLIPQTRKLEAI